MIMEPTIYATITELKAAFTEWDRRYRENPDEFMSEAMHLLKETPKTYGDACAPYFVKLLTELESASDAPLPAPEAPARPQDAD